MSKDNKTFEDQIGNLGGIPESTNEESLVGKKLRHIPGQKEELSDEEEKDMEAFINRSRRNHNNGSSEERGSNVVSMPSISEGWIPIDRSELGVRTKFYPEDWQFFVRPATVEAVKNWSAIDEERVDVVNSVFNDIIRTCVKITSSSGNIPWSRINSWDRFWFTLKVREYTFATGEAKIEFDDTCPECEQELKYTLTPQSLFYEFPDNNIVDKHWNSIERAWYIDPKDYDLDRPMVKLYVPTLEKDQAIIDWAIARSRANKKLDEVFLRFLPWMLSKVPKDQEVLEKFIHECEVQYKSWDVEMFDFMDEVIRNITINPSEKLRQVCPHCGEEVLSNVRFPNGIKALFKTEAKHKKFGSK
jgi:hypothetical protein